MGLTVLGHVQHHGPEHVAIDRVRWECDSATVLLTDGSELFVDVRAYDGDLRVELDCVLEPGLELHTAATAEPWVRAHADVLLAGWEAHCLEEREERAIDDFDRNQVEYWR